MSSYPILDQQELMSRIDGDVELLEELLEIFHEDYPQLCEQIEQAIQAGNADQLRQAAHTLKGTVGNFAARRAYQLAYELEMMAKSAHLEGAAQLWQQLQEAVQQAIEAIQQITQHAA